MQNGNSFFTHVQTQAALVALVRAIPPYLDPLVCGDLTGPFSLFGVGVPVPKPMGEWQHPAMAAIEDRFERQALQGGRLLWNAGVPSAIEHPMRVAATTFLTGTVSSTSDLVKYLADRRMLPVWGSVLSVCQKAGRGQLRRVWQSPQGNLHVSFVLPRVPIFCSLAASIVVGCMVADALRRLGYAVSVKWPNDILLDTGCKVGGILLEEHGDLLIAGLGINLCRAPDATELRREFASPAAVLPVNPSGRVTSPFSLWRAICALMLDFYEAKLAGKEVAEALSLCQEYLAWLGKQVSLQEDGRRLGQGICLGLGSSGGLLLQASCGNKQEFFSGSPILAE